MENFSIIKKILRIDWLLIIMLILLVSIGCLALYSAAGGDWNPWANRHFQRSIFGFSLAFVIAVTDIKIIYKYAWVPFIISIILLLVLYLTSNAGVNRWLDLGFIKIQPSEIAKISIILGLARYFHDINIRDYGKIIYSLFGLLIALPIIILTLIQPDLGTAVMQILIVAVLIFLAGLRIWLLTLSVVGGIASLPLIWFNLHDYQKQRILTHLDPSLDILGAGYHINQSKIALGSGGVFGKGFLHGSQSHLDFLPEKQTDFIFTMIGEEFGLAGALFVLMIFVLLMLYCTIISFLQSSQFGRLLCSGIVFMLFSYVFVNVGMVSGLLPVVGAPLPLISYGGSSMLTIFISFGIILSASIHRFEKLEIKSN
jgi:rod shape determining protein RodA